jgi:RNA polymerase-binding transcription factor DksA
MRRKAAENSFSLSFPPPKRKIPEQRKRELAAILRKDRAETLEIIVRIKQNDRLACSLDKDEDQKLLRGYRERVRKLDMSIEKTLRDEFGFCKSCNQEIELEKIRSLFLTDTCRTCDARLAQEIQVRLTEEARLEKELQILPINRQQS